MEHLIFLDTETTGNDLERDRLCQICYKTPDGIHSGYFKPPVPMSIKSMSITHITNRMLEDKAPFKGSTMMRDLQARFDQGGVLVAHNARFDCAMLEAEGMSIPKRICTFRVARHLDPENEIPEYNLQYLRYYFDLPLEGVNPHDAVGDVQVLYALFGKQLEMMKKGGVSEEKAIAEMMDISRRPHLFKLFPFGKYKNRSIEEIAYADPGYLQWMLDKKMEEGGQDEDWIHTLQYYLKK